MYSQKLPCSIPIDRTISFGWQDNRQESPRNPSYQISTHRRLANGKVDRRGQY